MTSALGRLHRSLRYHPVTERARMRLRRTGAIALPEVGMDIPAEAGDVMIDCGANVGDITSRMARTGATVYAFEPNPRAFAILTRRFRGVPWVHCRQQGVMADDSELTLRVPIAYGGFDDIQTTVAGSFRAESNRELEIESVKVRCIGLADFVRTLKCRVRLIKIDIEGAEIEVVNKLLDTGAIDMVDQIVVETHERQMPELLSATDELKRRVSENGLQAKIRLDWV